MTTGIVKWFDNKKGYGLTSYDDTKEVFIHFIAIEGEGFKTLEGNQVVGFEIIEGSRGTQAAHVRKGNVQTADTNIHEQINKQSETLSGMNRTSHSFLFL